MNDSLEQMLDLSTSNRNSTNDASRALPLLACASSGGAHEVARVPDLYQEGALVWRVKFAAVVCGVRFTKTRHHALLHHAQYCILRSVYDEFGKQEVRDYVKQVRANLTQGQIDHLKSTGVY